MSVKDIKHSIEMQNLTKTTIDKNNEILTVDELFNLADLYFYKKNVMYVHNFNSFNKFIDDDIKNFLTNGDNTFFEKITKDESIKYKFEFDKISIRPPVMGADGQYMFPSDARENNLTYSAKLIARVTQVQEISDIYTKQVKSKRVIGNPEDNVPIATIPIMIRSKYCSLNLKKDYDANECEYDPGCYFIIGGNEKVVISQERMCENKPLVFIKKDSNSQIHVVQVNSRSPKMNGQMQVMTINLKNNGLLTLRAPILIEFPIMILFRALGIESDKEIIDYIVYDKNDTDMIDMIIKTIRMSTDEKGTQIKTQYDAINYLAGKIRVVRKYSETDKDVRQKQKRLHLEHLLENNFLFHITGGKQAKAYYIGYMINRLLNCALGRVLPDDRDSYLNKRVDLVGNLMDELFRQFFRKMINECNKYFKKRNTNDENPINIINQIRPNTIEQGLNAALLTGAWGVKKGVAQVLQRLTYLQAIEFFRRIDSPSNDASSSKLTHPRHLHATQNANLCCVVGDTEIIMSDRITRKKIRDITNADSILTINPETLEEEISQIHSFFKKQPEKIIKLTTMTGRTIKCTPEHPILIQTNDGNVWSRADNLKLSDNVIIKHLQDYLPIDKKTEVIIKSIDIDKQYVNELLEIGLINKSINQYKLEITARLLGASITDGHIGIRQNQKYYDCEFCVGEDTDAFQIVNDIIKLGFDAPKIRQRMTTHINKEHGKKTIYNTYNVSKNGAFAYYLAYMGGFIGRKTNMQRVLPDWLLNANSRIKQEFLSSFQGGDGCRLGIWTENKTNKIRLPPTSQTTTEEFKNDTIEYMKTISNMFLEFGINSNVEVRPSEEKYKVEIIFDQSLKNMEKYCNLIGYRYCSEKQRKSASIIEYLKYKRYIISLKEKEYEKIVELYQMNKKIHDICEETKINYSVIKRIIENHRKGFIPQAKCVDIMSYEEFLSKYYIADDKILNSIIKIEDDTIEDVYDFTTVSNNHSFIANGIVVHNCVETPEHAKVGLVKHLTIIGSVTVSSLSQYQIIRQILNGRIKKLTDIHPSQMLDYTKIFFNGDWMGVVNNEMAYKLFSEMKELKYNGGIESTSSIIYDDEANELKVYCDTGRLYRPVIRVKNNDLLLTKNHIKMISPNKTRSETMITSWSEFMQRNPGVIENIDSEEQAYSMIASCVEDIYNMKHHETESKVIAKTQHTVDKTNRYGNLTFVKYSHSEIHPSLLLGLIATNIPFPEHNQGPRNIFQYAQGRQAMCIYISNYRFRLDTSYILYHPQKPLVNTRTSKYMYNDILSPGENAIVAIACYTGLNQEDSIVVNKSAIERGLFRTTSFNKYVSIIKKNQSTSQDDIFMKPDPTKVSGMKQGSYDKLNEKGFIPEETTVVNGDFIIGKVSPVQPTANSRKIYKDNSESYKQHVPGVIDKVYSDIYNVEGYEMKKIRVRSERIPVIGDKMCSRHG